MSSLLNDYIFFIWFYYLNFSILNSFNFFKKIFLNNNYFNFFNLKNNKKLYIYYYVMFKKQNSLMKKKFNYLHNLHPVFFKKKNFKKKFVNSPLKNKNVKLLRSYYILKLILKKKNGMKSFDSLHGKKKLKKTILRNRKLYKFLNFNTFKTSQKLSKSIRNSSKVKVFNHLLNLEYSLFNVILNTHIIKSYEDLRILTNTSHVFLNRNVVHNLNTVLNVGDLVEFVLTSKFFNYISYFKNIFKKHIMKVRNKIWHKLKTKNKSKLDFNKNSLINSVFKDNVLFNNNIPNYLEVDFYSLSIIVLIKNLKFKSLNINIKKILVVYLFKLYNWK
jgi:hypothetical protein